MVATLKYLFFIALILLLYIIAGDFYKSKTGITTDNPIMTDTK